jgi:molybdenum cofactor cytidylyltransferase
MADGPLVAVLAAGLGTRFGGGKLEAACAGKPLGRWPVEAVEAAGLEPGVIVTGPGGVSFAPGWTALANARPEDGLGSSLALAARLALAQDAAALLVLLADMPLVTHGYLRALAESHAPVATRHPDGRAGVPAVLGRELLEKAAQLMGDRGAGPLLAGVPLLAPPAGMLLDVDTPEALAKVEAILSR